MENRNSYKYAGIDFSGKRHGRLIALSKADKGRSWWRCKCDCGRYLDLPTWKFLTDQSCGCLEKENRENLGQHNRTHGQTDSRLYSVWGGIKDRCNNPNTEHYNRYGGRGISLCEEWQNSFESFMSWAYSAGYNDNLPGKVQSVDRIDVNGNYCPENCRLVNQSTQMRNTAKAVFILIDGEKVHIQDFCEKNGITYPHFVKRRIDKGISPEEIILDWKMKHENHTGYYSVLEAAKHYNVCQQSIMCWIRDGKLSAEKIGSSWYIPIGQHIARRSDRDESGRFLPRRKESSIASTP